jgi:hypothetical protein
MVLEEFAVLKYRPGIVITWPKFFAAWKISSSTESAWFGRHREDTLSKSDLYCIHVKGCMGFYPPFGFTTMRTLDAPFRSSGIVHTSISLSKLHAFGGRDGLTKSAWGPELRKCLPENAEDSCDQRLY